MNNLYEAEEGLEMSATFHDIFILESKAFGKSFEGNLFLQSCRPDECDSIMNDPP